MSANKPIFDLGQGGVILAAFIVLHGEGEDICHVMGMSAREPDGRRWLRLRTRRESPDPEKPEKHTYDIVPRPGDTEWPDSDSGWAAHTRRAAESIAREFGGSLVLWRENLTMAEWAEAIENCPLQEIEWKKVSSPHPQPIAKELKEKEQQ
jgi:hypothetical protein